MAGMSRRGMALLLVLGLLAAVLAALPWWLLALRTHAADLEHASRTLRMDQMLVAAAELSRRQLIDGAFSAAADKELPLTLVTDERVLADEPVALQVWLVDLDGLPGPDWWQQQAVAQRLLPSAISGILTELDGRRTDWQQRMQNASITWQALADEDLDLPDLLRLEPLPSPPVLDLGGTGQVVEPPDLLPIPALFLVNPWSQGALNCWRCPEALLAIMLPDAELLTAVLEHRAEGTPLPDDLLRACSRASGLRYRQQSELAASICLLRIGPMLWRAVLLWERVDTAWVLRQRWLLE